MQQIKNSCSSSPSLANLANVFSALPHHLSAVPERTVFVVVRGSYVNFDSDVSIVHKSYH